MKLQLKIVKLNDYIFYFYFIELIILNHFKIYFFIYSNNYFKYILFQF